MVSTNRPERPVAVRFISALCLVCALLINPSSATPEPIKIEFPSGSGTACAITSPSPGLLVSVYSGSSKLSKADWIAGKNRTELQSAGEDKITRLCFFKNPRPNISQAALWADDFRNENPGTLRAVAYSRTTNCTFEKWVTQIGDKVLPLGLLSVSFQNEIPPAGTPLVDSKGKIIGLILQSTSPTMAYAIPAQAVRRVQQDMVKHRKLVKGWLGIALSPGSQTPRITSVLPNSPAADAGILANDILVKAGAYPIVRYPDAVNALFYSVPGQTTSLQVLRDNRRLDYKMTPIAK